MENRSVLISAVLALKAVKAREGRPAGVFGTCAAEPNDQRAGDLLSLVDRLAATRRRFAAEMTLLEEQVCSPPSPSPPPPPPPSP